MFGHERKTASGNPKAPILGSVSIKPNSYDLKEMKLADYPQVFGLWKRSEGVGLTGSDSRKNIGLYLRRNPGLSQVALYQGKIVAAVLCGHDGRRGYLGHLAVEKAFRLKGLGRKLVERCLTGLKKRGILKCNIMVFRTNRKGLKFWTKNGWKQRKDLLPLQKRI